MKSARQWATDLKETMGMSFHPPEPLLGTGKTVLVATMEQVQLDILHECMFYAKSDDVALLRQNLSLLEKKITSALDRKAQAGV